MTIQASLKWLRSRGPIFWAGLILFVCFGIYALTAAPGVGPIDSAELSLVSKTLGIAHPTGYPLYTLMGRVWSMLLPWGELAGRLNIMSSLIMATTAAFLFLLFSELGVSYKAAVSATLLWAFSPLVWEQATTLEVYGLSILIGIILLWCSVRFRNGGRRRYLLLIGFISGLGLGNHLILLWFLPGITVIIRRNLMREQWRGWLLTAVFFFFGLSLYFYLPIRARLDPLYNWGDPSSWERFINHVTGRQYRVWMFRDGWSKIVDKIGYFFSTLIRQPTVFLSWLILPGMIRLWFQNRNILLAVASILLFSSAYAVNYNIPDISSYFLPAVVAAAIMAGFGLHYISRIIDRSSLHGEAISLGLMLILPISTLLTNFVASNRHGDNFTQCYANDVLLSAAPNGVIVTGNWDLYAPCLYLIQEKGYRPDLILLDKELLRRGWYFRYLGKQYPDLVDLCRQEINDYLPLLERFEKNLPYDASEIQARYIRLLNSILLRNYYDRPAYLGENPEKGDYTQLVPSCQLVPEGLLYRAKLPGAIQMLDFDSLFCQKYRAHDTIRLSQRERVLYKNYPRMLYQRGVYMSQSLCYDQSLNYFRRALEYDPGHPAIYIGLGGAYMGINKVEEAAECFRRAQELDPSNEVARENLDKLKPFLKKGGATTIFR